MTFIFCGYYSNSFDNYKIIDSIIFKNQKHVSHKKEKVNDNNEIELSNDFKKEENLIDIKSENINEHIILDQKENETDNYCGETEREEKISNQDI